MTSITYHGRPVNINLSDTELRSRIEELSGYERLTRAQHVELEQYQAADEVRKREYLEKRAEQIRGGDRSGTERVGETPASTPSTPPPRRDTGPNGRMRDLARSRLDVLTRDGELPDHAAAKVERMVTDGPQHSQGLAARWAVATGAPEYRTAFAKLCADPERGHLLWTTEEQRSYQAVAAVQSEQRAMGIGTGSGGGHMVPLTLDPAVILTSDGSVNPLRQVSRVVQISTDSWNGVTSAGVTSEWKAEHAEVADATPTLARPGIPVHFGDAFVPYSFEVGMDAVNFLGELRDLLADAADQLQAEAFMNGSGSGQPTGITTALPAGSKVATATADAVVVDDVVGLQNELPPRFQPRARWLGNLATINEIASFETTNGALRFPEVGSGNLLRKPLDEASALEAAGATATAGNDNVLLYGDFRQFVIVDRIGTTLELVPHIFGANNRPTGQRGALLWFRTGSDVVVDNAFRLLTS